MRAQKKIGLFFGTFNPIHVGHLIIANFMAEYTDLQQVWFVVSPQNPMKKKDSLLPERQRLAMVNEAIGDDTRFKGSNIEFGLPKPSYTINTLTYLQEKHPNTHFALIMGSDNLQNFTQWKNHEQILSQHSLYVYPRPGFDGGELKDHPAVKVTNCPLMEISSTFIRQAVKEKKDVSHFMPPAAYHYMKEMHFYEK